MIQRKQDVGTVLSTRALAPVYRHAQPDFPLDLQAPESAAYSASVAIASLTISAAMSPGCL